MAHRGRLNVLAQVMGKPHRAIFHEFKGGSSTPDDVEGSGDVKYHLGASSDREFDGNKVHLSLTANPSHLEIVDPVVLGKVRAKQDQHGATPEDRTMVMPLLIHGDAAFAGQGVVAECFGLSGLRGHRTGGSVHFIVNNQIGFTTYPRYSRSSPYPSDVAKMIEAPIFHVNGDDPGGGGVRRQGRDRVPAEIPQAGRHRHVLLPPLRPQRGRRAVVHPAADVQGDPRASDRRSRSTPRSSIGEGVVTEGEVEKMRADWRARLDAELEASQGYKRQQGRLARRPLGRHQGAARQRRSAPRQHRRRRSTTLQGDRRARSPTVPQGFHVHRTIQRFLDNRAQGDRDRRGHRLGDRPRRWPSARCCSKAIRCGCPARTCERGTFSQRHSVLIDQENEERYTPLNHLADKQARFEVINSMLSEEAVLGFEYGYSLAEPNALTLWEAQFGDFANGAQVVFDQFISSGERKWLRMSGLVCLLPHGYEGQGPEHSSARLERFLQMCAEDNMQVANCTTPANYFHILRRQLQARLPQAADPDDAEVAAAPQARGVAARRDGGRARRSTALLWDDAQMLPDEKIKLVADDKIRRVVLCSGKVYYDLYEEREKRGIDDIYLLRVEQLYPFPTKALVHRACRASSRPRSSGARRSREHGRLDLRRALSRMGARPDRRQAQARRAMPAAPASAATAAGLMSKHLAQLKALLDEALG